MARKLLILASREPIPDRLLVVFIRIDAVRSKTHVSHEIQRSTRRFHSRKFTCLIEQKNPKNQGPTANIVARMTLANALEHTSNSKN